MLIPLPNPPSINQTAIPLLCQLLAQMIKEVIQGKRPEQETSRNCESWEFVLDVGRFLVIQLFNPSLSYNILTFYTIVSYSIFHG